jgi:hypothetical protein
MLIKVNILQTTSLKKLVICHDYIEPLYKNTFDHIKNTSI